MARAGSLAVTLMALILAFAGTTLAQPRAQPSGRAGLQLLPGTVGTDSWTKGSPSTQTSAAACRLTLAKPGAIRTVTGIWRTVGVSRWSFGRQIPTTKPFFGNVRLLSDGRVTKI